MEALCLEDSGGNDLGEQFGLCLSRSLQSSRDDLAGRVICLDGVGGTNTVRAMGMSFLWGCSNENGDSAGQLRGCAAGCGLFLFVT